MKKTYFPIVVLFLILLPVSCGSETDNKHGVTNIKMREKIIAAAEAYVNTQLNNPQKAVSELGIIAINDQYVRYVIDPTAIVAGYIDDDRRTDAIITLYVFRDQFQTVSQQLILLGSPGNEFTLAGAIESDMKVISVKNGIITADVPEHSRDTPLFNCPSCWEVVKFRFSMGELVREE
ncbi:MAG: hypothetical protein RBT38_03745 [Bacteroidales bacterium]|jgi:hypothetical protein|nr:hypothetical protein [Bacteroidales bacterium]